MWKPTNCKKSLEKIGRVLIPCVPQICEITCLPVDGSAPYHPWTRTVKNLHHTIPAFEAAAIFVPFKHLFMIHGPRPQFFQPDRKIRELLPEISSPAIKNYLALQCG